MSWTILLPALLLLPNIVVAVSASKCSSIKWTNCTKNDPKNLSCGTIEVPINWADPTGPKIELFLARVAAKNQDKKIGSLIFNPGGPGESASALLIETAGVGFSFFGKNVQEYFDIVGPDPRGIGGSHPLTCDPKIFNQRVRQQPTTEAEFHALVKHSKDLGESCRKLTGPVLGCLDSRSVAQDFDAIRGALGDKKLTYLGISYGTVIGQAYAELFPKRIRAMALDGNIDHSLSEVSMLAEEVQAYENEFVRFSTWCAKTKSCPLHGMNVIKLFKNLVASADKKPIPAPGCKKSGSCRLNVTGEEIRFNFRNMLIFKKSLFFGIEPGWKQAAAVLKKAHGGDATGLSSPLAKSAHSATIYSANGNQVWCLDWNHEAKTLSDLVYKEQLTRELAPITQGAGAVFGYQSQCIGWPEPVRYKPHLINVTQTPPILMTNSYHDPETPYTWANGLQDQLKTAILATRRGDGHTSYFLGGETSDAIDDYLVTLKTPRPNTVFKS